MELWNRAYRLQVDDLELTGLDVQFRAQKTLQPEPDTLELTIYNLKEESRAKLQWLEEVFVRLEAGYRPNPVAAGVNTAPTNVGVQDTLPLIFSGTLRSARSHREGPDWVTVIASGDGDDAKKTRVNMSFGPGATLAFAVDQVAQTLGLGLGKLPTEIANAKLADGGQQFSNGIVLSGNGFEQLTRLLDSAGLQWCVQDGEIVVTRRGLGAGDAAVLAGWSGLIGSPTLGTDGRINFRALLQPEILPGRQVLIESRLVGGYFQVESAVYIGDTAGQDWYIDGEALRVG